MYLFDLGWAHQIVSWISNSQFLMRYYVIFVVISFSTGKKRKEFNCSNWKKKSWKQFVKQIGKNIRWIRYWSCRARSLQIVFRKVEQISNYFEIFFLISIFQLGYHTLGSANTPVAIWRDTRKWLESFMGNSQWETAPTYTWLSRSFRIFNESMLEQRCKRQANHGWDFDRN